MRYQTELMQEILQNPVAQRMIDFVAPIYGESYTALWLFEIIGRTLGEISDAAKTLCDQTVPHKADWSLPYWEKEYNISPNASWTTEQRREAVIARMKYYAPVNPHKLAAFASAAAGVPCKIVENIARNTFAVSFEGYVQSLERLVSVVEGAKPAHLIWQVHSRQEISAVTPVIKTVVLAVSGWNNNTQTIAVPGVTASNAVIVAPAAESMNEAGQRGVRCAAQDTDSLDFVCSAMPENDLIYHILIINAQ